MKKYSPHKYQLEFHKSKARFRTFIAGRRGGKSLAGTIEALKHSDLDPLVAGRPVHGMIIAPTYGMLKDVNIAMMMEWCPDTSIKSWNKVDMNLELVNGSTITFRSGDNPDRLRGTGKDWIWLDEACFMNKYVWEVVYPTLTSTNGIAWITTTPQGYDWVYDSFYKPAIDGDKDYQAWKFTTLDNPYIDADLVEKARNDMTDVMFRQEYLASFEKFEGLIYPDFNNKLHIRNSPNKITDTYFVGLDVGWNHPTACVLVKEDKEHNLFVIDEFREQYMTVDKISNRLRGLIEGNGLTPDKIEMFIIDPASRGTQQSSGQSMLDQLLEEGWGFIPGDNDVMAGINRITRLIKDNKLFVGKRCVSLTEEFNNYHWKQWGEDSDNAKNKPYKLGDDLMDALRYVIQTRPDYYDHPQLDMYGRIVQEGADPVTGFMPEEGTPLDRADENMDSWVDMSKVDDMMG